MALCLAESILTTPGFDSRSQLSMYVRWLRLGHMSSNGRCFDVGRQTAASLTRFEKGQPAPKADERAGNGSLMRLAPVPIAWQHDPESAIRLAGESSSTTHASSRAVDSCRFYAALVVGALNGASKEELLDSSAVFSPRGLRSGFWQEHPLHPSVLAVALGSYKTKPESEISNTGMVPGALEAALWAFWRTSSFEEGALLVTNRGDDADTVAAIFGMLAGAFYGVDGIPEQWRRTVFFSQFIELLAVQLEAFSSSPAAFVVPQDLRDLFGAIVVLEEGYGKIYKKLAPGPGPPTPWPGGYQQIEKLDADIGAFLKAPFEALGGVKTSLAGQSLVRGYLTQVAEDRKKMVVALQRRPAVASMLEQIRKVPK